MKVPSTILFVAMLAGASIFGCETTRTVDTTSNEPSIPEVTALYEKATDVHVRRFRKPYRDRRARLLRELEQECDRLLAETRDWENTAELTAAGPKKKEAIEKDISTLRSSLERLRDAAAGDNEEAMESAHRSAVAAYDRIESGLSLSAGENR